MEMKKKYGLWTATAMVIGIVVGSGIFFKTSDILNESGKNAVIGLIALALGALAMVFGAQVFGSFAQKVEKTNGIIDYVEYAFGRRWGYLIGWFKSYIYFPSITSVLGWASAHYTLLLFNYSVGDAANSWLTWVLAAGYIVLFFIWNYFAPLLAGKFQVSSTIIKLVPILVIGVVATICGLVNGVALENFTTKSQFSSGSWKALFDAVVLTAFAYEGWIIATTINQEIKESKKVLPKALFIGTITVTVVSILFYLGVTSYLPIENINNEAVKTIASSIFGTPVAGTIVMGFIVISCLGTLNGLALGSIRSPYSVAIRGDGIAPKQLSKLSKKTSMPKNSAIVATCLTLVLLTIWYGNFNGWYSFLTTIVGTNEIDTSTFPIAFVYFAYVAIYVYYMIMFKDQNVLKRFIIPILALIGSSFILIGAFTNPKVMPGMIFSFVFTAVGLFFYRGGKAKTSQEKVEKNIENIKN